MALAKKATAPYLNAGVKVKPFRVERPPTQLELALRQARQIRLEVIEFVVEEIIQMTVDTLYVMRYLRAKFGVQSSIAAPSAYEQRRGQVKDMELVNELSGLRVEHAPLLIER